MRRTNLIAARSQRAGDPRPRRLAGVLLVLFLLSGLVWTPEASAHPVLRRSSPAANDTLRSPPSEVRLVFSVPVESRLSKLELQTADGRRVGLGPVRIARQTELVAIPEAALAAGTYVVRWQVAGADGHPVRGTFGFVIVAAPAAAPPASAPTPTVPGPTQHPVEVFPEPHVSDDEPEGFGVQSAPYAAIRAALYAGLLALIGVVGFRGFVLRTADRRLPGLGREWTAAAERRAAAAGIVAAAALIVLAAARLWAQAYAARMPGTPIELELVATLVLETTWGSGWILQVVGATVALLAFIAVRRSRVTGWYGVGAATLLLAFSPALSGHATAVGELGPLPVLADALHVLGAGGWLGTLLILLIAGLPATRVLPRDERGPAVAALVTAFSPVALVCAGTAALTGVFAAWLHLGDWAAVWGSDYGRALLLKLGVLAVVAATGAYNWRVVRPSLGEERAAGRLRPSATVELVVAVLVIVVTAVLVATPPPADAAMAGR